MEPPADETKTWYELHKEQVKLIQFLLYHLKKYEKKITPPTDPKPQIKKTEGEFICKFE